MPALATEPRIKWIELGGKPVLFMDFSHLPVTDSLALIEDFKRALDGRAPGSVLMLSDVTGAEYDPSIARQWKEARLERDHLIRASAIYGLAGLVGIAVRGFYEARRILGLDRDGRRLRMFSHGAEARAWLAEQ